MVNYLLNENECYILQENGDRILLEVQATAAEPMRLDIQKIIKTHGMQANLIRESENIGSMGDTKYAGQKGYTIFFIMQDITKKDRQIHEMGLAIPGNVKGFFYDEYPRDITGHKDLIVQAGDMIRDKNNFWWRIEQIVGGRKAKSKEIFRTAVLKKIGLTQ